MSSILKCILNVVSCPCRLLKQVPRNNKHRKRKHKSNAQDEAGIKGNPINVKALKKNKNKKRRKRKNLRLKKHSKNPKTPKIPPFSKTPPLNPAALVLVLLPGYFIESPPRIIHKEITFYPSKSPSPPEKHHENLNDSFFELSSVFKQANTKKDRDSTCEEVSNQRYFKIHKKMPFGTKEDLFRQDSFNINPLNSVNSNLKNAIDNMGPMSSVVFKSKKESDNITLGRSRVSSKTSSNKNQHTGSLHDICEKEEYFKNDELNSSNHVIYFHLIVCVMSLNYLMYRKPLEKYKLQFCSPRQLSKFQIGTIRLSKTHKGLILITGIKTKSFFSKECKVELYTTDTIYS
ncbi:unnamed protein product [Moneuplotes crassus]|uniref:Uncharacterized protein n=1 Tax=Euplotes crassus TaxID=5936 RepID=A0AAD1U4X8_EUPCR|nr:unnamed protein product [Moneuplotes crassus]